jgi:hypothetical protein
MNRPLTSYNNRKFSFVLGMLTTSGVQNKMIIKFNVLYRKEYIKFIKLKIINTLETKRIFRISARYTINEDLASVHDHPGLAPCQCIMKSVSEDNDSWNAFTCFVGTWRWFWCLSNQENRQQLK